MVKKPVFDSLSVDEKKQLVANYAAYMTETGFDGQTFKTPKERELNYHVFLKIAHVLIPEVAICSYFYDCYEKNVINLKGLNELIACYNSKEKYKDQLNSAVAISVDDLGNQLSALSELEQGEKLLLVNIYQKHITPVFMRKYLDKTDVIIMDSLGDAYSSYRWGTKIEQMIRKHSLGKVGNPINIYKVYEKRQNDGSSCPIFSMRDLLEHTKVDMFKFVQSEKENIRSHPGCDTSSGTYLIDRLPARFIKVAQHVETIERYMDSAERVSSPSKTHGGDSGEARTLKQVKGEYCSPADYVRKRAYKYYQVLINKILGLDSSRIQVSDGQKVLMR